MIPVKIRVRIWDIMLRQNTVCGVLYLQKHIAAGNISINPFDEKLINPNSYNLRLHNELLVYTDEVLEKKKPLHTESLVVPEDGLVLQPYQNNTGIQPSLLYRDFEEDTK